MAGVNPALAESLMHHITLLAADGLSVVFIEHDMNVVSGISDWVVVLEQGESSRKGLLACDPQRTGGRRLSRSRPSVGRPGEQRGIIVSALLKAEDLVAGYLPGVDILNGCSLELNPGEVVGIIGPNGAGKSTLLKAIFGLVEVRAGTVHFEAEDITGHQPHELVSRGIGFVPQTDNVFGRLSIRETWKWARSRPLTGSLSGLKWSPICSPCLADRSRGASRWIVGR